MELADILLFIGALIGGGGIGGVAMAMWNIRKAVRQEPLDLKTIEVKHQVDLVGAADQLVHSQTSVIERLEGQIAHLATSVDEERAARERLEGKLERVLDDLENERREAAERSHELESYRLALATERERVAQLEARVDVLEQALRENDIDPDDISGAPA